MRTYTLKKAKNHIELTAVITGNSFGDQIIEIIKENLDGSKECLAVDSYPENNHLSVLDIQMIYGDSAVNKKIDSVKSLDT